MIHKVRGYDLVHHLLIRSSVEVVILACLHFLRTCSRGGAHGLEWLVGSGVREKDFDDVGCQ